jgi:DNA-binding CsgD family transcriptional regulator
MSLSEHEKACLLWTARGGSSWEIGRILSISENTVAFHIKNAMRKLGRNSRTLAAVKAIQLGRPDRGHDRGGLMIRIFKGFVFASMVRPALLAALGLGLALSACVTAENPLSQTYIAGMKLTGVNVSFAPKASVIWEEGERAYAGARTMSDAQVAEARRTQEYKDYVHAMLGARIKAGVEQAMAGQLIGARPVRLEIVVSRFYVPSVASRVLIGGDPQMFAAATLVDARTGAVILAHPDLEAFVHGGAGIIGTAVQAAIDSSRNETQEDRLIANYGQTYREWLTHGA